MALNIVPQASQKLSCQLLKLPPELRLLIYAYTHQFSLDLEVDEYDREDLSKAWESTHLVKLAATCRLIANETRDYVRSLPSARRTAMVDLLDSHGATLWVTVRMRHLTCPIADLRHVVVRYNFQNYESTAYRSLHAHRRLAIDLAISGKARYLLHAIRRLMADVNMEKATNLNDVWLRIIGLQPRRDGESYLEAARRIRDPPSVTILSAENLALKIFQCGRRDAGVGRDASTHRLASFGEKRLLLVIPKKDRK